MSEGWIYIRHVVEVVNGKFHHQYVYIGELKALYAKFREIADDAEFIELSGKAFCYRRCASMLMRLIKKTEKE